MKIPFAIAQWRREHLFVALALMAAAAAGYGVATISRRPFDAFAAEPRIPAAPPVAAATPAQLSSPTAQPIPVVTPRMQSVKDYLEIEGNAQSVNAVKLIARVEGYLEKIH